MSKQPEALRLADAIDSDFDPDWMLEEGYDRISAELRRLYEAHDWQHKMAGDRLRRIEKLEAVNQGLLEALKKVLATGGHARWEAEKTAYAIIAKAEGA